MVSLLQSARWPRALCAWGAGLCLIAALGSPPALGAPALGPATAPLLVAEHDSAWAAVQTRLRLRLDARQSGLDALATTHANRALVQFYVDRGFALHWVGADGPHRQVNDLLQALDVAPAHGLRSADYHRAEIEALRREMTEAAKSPDPDRAVDLELLCTDAFLLYGSHLLNGRVSATSLEPAWTLEGRRGDLLATLVQAVSTDSVASTLAALAPPQPGYRRLQTALQQHRVQAATGGWSSLPDGPALQRGDTGPRVAALRNRLQASMSVADSSAASRFDDGLDAAVRAFQRQHGLEPDGVVGSATRQALNVPVEARIRQLEVNLERWRWLPSDLGDRHIRVNIAGFSLSVVERDTTVLTMRVVTGRPYRQTPVFSGRISYLVFNPYWHIPPSLAVQDKLPEIQNDPGYFAQQNIKVFRGWGADAVPLDPATIDWKALSARNFPYRLRQDPGPNNALGRVKFMFPNPHNVYLHDTPSRSLFGRAERPFSSGCIRVERPQELAAWLLADRPEWTEERIRTVTAATSSNETTVLLRAPVPVHLLYATAWADEDGVAFRTDVYNRDARVHDALTASIR